MYLRRIRQEATEGILYHIPVLKQEVVSYLEHCRNGIIVDGTAGGGGHIKAILQAFPEPCTVIGADRDPDAIAYIYRTLGNNLSRLKLHRAPFSDMEKILEMEEIESVDGILLDLGISSFQIDQDSRGFSYRLPGPLDMRMSKNGQSAGEVLNTGSFEQLKYIFSEYGEEKFAHVFARAIITERERTEFTSTGQLFDVIKNNIGKGNLYKSASRIFQALRIEVNKEMDELKRFLSFFPEILVKNGRVCVISYHSLEDKMVKKRFQQLCSEEFGPREDPTGILGEKPQFKMVTRKAVKPSEAEIKENPRARSARLRVIEKTR